jgi:TetR/AcrR family transcriptional regulator
MTTHAVARTRREEILDIAMELFAEHGYEGTSMSDLAERVGLRKASLFHHFESKEVLYAAVLARLLEGVGRAISAGSMAPGTFEERLDALTDAITNLLGEQPFAARLLVREVMDWGPVARDQLAGLMQGALNTAVAFLQAGQDAGAFARADARQLVISLTGVHFMPFAIGRVVEPFFGVGPMDPAFLEPRRTAVRAQVRKLLLAKQ